MLHLVTAPKTLRLVILDCPYDTWDSAQTRDLFDKMVALKLRGYQAEYPYTVLPVDTSDFIATHILICAETQDGLEPIYAFKSVTLERCEAFRLQFPAMNLAQATGNDGLCRAMSKIIQEARLKRKNISYDGSRTQEPSLDKETKILLKDLFRLAYVRYCESYGIDEELAAGVTRFHVEKGLYHWNFEDILDPAGRAIGPVSLPLIFNETVVVLHKKKAFPAEVTKFTPEIEKYWDNRLEINAPRVGRVARKKAA